MRFPDAASLNASVPPPAPLPMIMMSKLTTHGACRFAFGHRRQRRADEGRAHRTHLGRVRLQQLGNRVRSSPSDVTPHATARVAVKVLVEQNVVAEVRIAGELGVIFEHRPLAIRPLQEEARQTTPQFLGHLVQGKEFAGPGRTFDFEVITVVVVKSLQGLDDEIVDRHPNGTAPIRVAAEQSAARLTRPVTHFVVRCRRLQSGTAPARESSTSARTPYSDRKLFSSSIRRSSAFMR